MEGNFLVAYECCQIVEGFQQSIIYDFQRKKNQVIPNDLATLLKLFNKRMIDDIFEYYDKSLHETIIENIEFLINKEYYFLTKDPDLFPSMELDWDEPALATNCIIEVGEYLLDNKAKIWDELQVVGCEHIEIRGYKVLNLAYYYSIFEDIEYRRISSIQLIIALDQIEISKLISFLRKYPRIKALVIHSVSSDYNVEELNTLDEKIIFTASIIGSNEHCGNFGVSSFGVNIKMFTEAKNNNSCLNRKVSIDNNGHIKNCPSMPDSFGHIEKTKLVEALDAPGFKKYWSVSKDFIDICKDCEFRYMCHDCRAYVEEPNDNSGPKDTNLSKPLKCGYNPYTGEWSEWSTNPLKQKAIDFYGMREMVDTTA